MATEKKTKKSKAVGSVEVLSLYNDAVSNDLTHQELLESMVTELGMGSTELAQARLNRLNSFLRTEFDGAELQVLRGAPRMPKTTKRLRQLFSDALIKVEARKVKKKLDAAKAKEAAEEAVAGK